MGRRHAGIVRVGESQVQEEGTVFGPRTQKLDRAVHDFASRLAAGAILLVVEIVAVIEALVNFHGFVATLAVVPGDVTRVPEGIRQVGVRARSVALVAEIGPPAQQHVAAGQADRGDVRTQAVRVAEYEAGAGQAVHVRGVNMRIAQRMDRIRALIIGEQKRDVGPRPGVSCREQARESEELPAEHVPGILICRACHSCLCRACHSCRRLGRRFLCARDGAADNPSSWHEASRAELS
jgi:hypothetical protein